MERAKPAIACSLLPLERAQRQSDFREIAARALLRSERTPSGARLLFRRAEEVRVRELIALEKDCCPFFEFGIDVRGDLLQVDVAAPAEAHEMLNALLQSMSSPGRGQNCC